MSRPPDSPEECYAAIVQALAGQPGVQPGVTSGENDPAARGQFGSSGLKVGDKLFAMLACGRFVVKLSRQRVDALVAAGDGERYDPRRDGRAMKEWLTVEPSSHTDWLSLAREAMEFVAAKS